MSGLPLSAAVTVATTLRPPRVDQALPERQCFRQVIVGPSRDRDTPGVEWPDFDAQTTARLWRYGRRVCRAPGLSAGDIRHRVETPASFVSMYDNHFGHMVAETVPRLAQTLTEAPDLPLVFTCDRPTRFDQTSAMFRSVLDWFGIGPDRVLLIHEPTLFAELHIAAQGEISGGPGPSARYLELLEGLTHRSLPAVEPGSVTYVTRAAMPPEKGIHAGEAYLVDALRRAGVRVVFPEKLPLARQMALYASSAHLVFAEGSAMHGRQLIGRIDQQIAVLRRRFRSTVAQHELSARCRTLTYVPCFAGALAASDATGRKLGYAALTHLNMDPVFDYFDGLGVALRPHWDWGAYQRLRDHDALRWVSAIYSPGVYPWLRPHNTDAELLENLDAIGLGHLKDAAQTLMRAGRASGNPAG